VILERINACQQGQKEPVSDYVKKMSDLFQELPYPLPEKEQVRLVYRNILDSIKPWICTNSYDSVRHLAADARKVEESLKRADRPIQFTEQLTRPQTNEQSRPKKEKVDNRTCYNCGMLGHISPRCPMPRVNNDGKKESNRPQQRSNQGAGNDQ